MPGALRASAVVCTHDRRRDLERAVESLLHQSAPRDVYEILVVDNASSDDTAHYLDGIVASGAPIRRLFVDRPGLSRARNAALAQARGEIVAFLDDDAVASEDWIERILRAFDAGGPSVGVLGGRTLPIWEAARPDWLSDRGLGALAIVDWSEEPGFLAEGQYLVGANMAFRARLLREIGGFPEQLGRMGGALLSGEETFVAARLAARGHRPFYDPSVIVHHRVQRERARRSWLLRRAYWQGVSNVVAEGRSGLAGAASGAAGDGLRLLADGARALPRLARRDRAGCFDRSMDAARAAGALVARLAGAAQRARSAGPPASVGLSRAR